MENVMEKQMQDEMKTWGELLAYVVYTGIRAQHSGLTC